MWLSECLSLRYDLPVTRQHILDEIHRTAKTNGGVPLGKARFEQETGIRYYDWWGKYWSRWGDAVREAGFAANTLQDAFDDDEVIEKLIGLIRELGHFPVTGELRVKKHNDSSFPNHKVFAAHFGSRVRLRAVVVEYCRSHAGSMMFPTCAGQFLTVMSLASMNDQQLQLWGSST